MAEEQRKRSEEDERNRISEEQKRKAEAEEMQRKLVEVEKKKAVDNDALNEEIKRLEKLLKIKELRKQLEE